MKELAIVQQLCARIIQAGCNNQTSKKFMPLLQHQNIVMYTQLKPLIICTFVALYSFSCKATETVRISKKLQWADLSAVIPASGLTPDFVDAYRDQAFGELTLVFLKQ